MSQYCAYFLADRTGLLDYSEENHLDRWHLQVRIHERELAVRGIASIPEESLQAEKEIVGLLKTSRRDALLRLKEIASVTFPDGEKAQKFWDRIPHAEN